MPVATFPEGLEMRSGESWVGTVLHTLHCRQKWMSQKSPNMNGNLPFWGAVQPQAQTLSLEHIQPFPECISQCSLLGNHISFYGAKLSFNKDAVEQRERL